ncbi:beta-cubebene synthase-like isoform X1 [Tasmannia lanceolata]|uniref:beta-cubebene synthase-like isoform X1 n=1 Tax=Tasmannia lanceolata TaxID=3420 RepID=UPI00406288AD
MALEGCPSDSSPTLHSSSSEKEVVRQSANFHPNLWGEFVHTLSSHEIGPDALARQRIEELKEEVSCMLSNSSDPFLEMNLIDTLELLGVAYHFETQIEEALSRIYIAYTNGGYNDDDLNDVSLRFGLLRQHRYNVSSDVFLKFMDDEGNFNVILASDALGMLNLYEAAHLSTQGEIVLDNALAFTAKHLQSMIPHLSPTLARHVEKSLELPLQKSLPRPNARQYITLYQEQSTKNEVLLELAKLDFNLLQSIHQRELRDISRWWIDIDLPTKLPFTRDRVVDLYFWILGVYFEPQYCRARMILTKIISFISIMDDIYDVYSTLDELQILTAVIQWWDIGAMDQLPEYMKVYFHALVNTVSEIEEGLTPDEKYRITYLKESMKCLNRAYFEEAKWFHSGDRPTFEEYMNIALITAGYPFLIIVSYIGMDEIVKKEAFDLINSFPNIIKSTCILGRVLNDIQSRKFEKERGHIPSVVEFYMKSHRCAELEAHEKLQEMVSVAWKDINQEFINLNHIPMPVITRCLSNKFRRFMIYVHAKGMIVDDEYVLRGSANINQRSLDGSRDTEIAMGAYQPNYTWAGRQSHPHGQCLSNKFLRFMIYVHAKGMIVDDEYVLMGSANINQRSLDGSRDTEIAMGAYQPNYTWAGRQSHPHGQVYGYRMSLWAEHLVGSLEDSFREPQTLKCVRRVNQLAKDNWKSYVSDDMKEMKGHLMKYPIQVERDGRIGPLPGNENFPDVGGKILGGQTTLPDVLTT